MTQRQRSLVSQNVAPQVQLNLKQNWFDHLKIFMYHFIEPMLLAIAMSLCLQLPTLSTLVYTLVMFLGILPLTLSSNSTNIKFKWFLSFLMILMAFPLFIFKAVMIVKYNRDPTSFEEKEELWQFLGIFGDYPVLTLLVDVIQIVISSILVWHLNDQKKQSCRINTMTLKRLELQTEIKLYHPYFGRKWKPVLLLTLSLYLVDTFIMMSVPQLLVVVLLISIVLFWKQIGSVKHPAMSCMVKLIQIISIMQILTAFFLSLPIVGDDWQAHNVILCRILGIVGTQDEKPYVIYARIHFCVVCFAAVSTEAFAVSSKIYDMQLKRMQEIGSGANQGFGSGIYQTRELSEKSAVRASPISNNQKRDSIASGMTSVANRIDPSRRLQRGRMITQKSNPVLEQKSCWNRLKGFWVGGKASLLIWVCRLISFIWAYCYHDWQSVIILIWLLHSTLYRNSQLFRKFMVFCYLPLVTAIFLWYYVINIFGLIDWTSDPTKRIQMYTFGFYDFQIPSLEIAFMFCGLLAFIQLTFSLESSADEASKKFLNQIGSPKGSLLYHFLFLFLTHVEYPMMLFLVVAGLDKMDIYHIVMLLFFVWYTLKPSIIKNNSIFLLVYANVFVLEKYIYTMFQTSTEPQNWVIVIGLSTNYDPDSEEEYFRYKPRFDQWILVFLTFCLYRRQELLGTRDQEKSVELRKKAEDQVKLRMPKLYAFYIYCDIIYTYLVVILAFTLYLVITVLIPESLMNAITQTLVLSLLLIYLANGIKKLMKYWYILIFYQAIVLVLMVVFQFMVQSPDFEDSKMKEFFDSWPSYMVTWCKWLGFVKFEDPINLKLLPYVIFFSLAVILAGNFRAKLQIENRQLYSIEDVKNSESQDLLQQVQDKESETKSPPDQLKAHLERAKKETEYERRLEQMMTQDESGAYQHLESELVFNYGQTSGLAKDTLEILHHKQKMTMSYKLSYMIYRMKLAWPVFNVIAAYFYLVLYVIILAFALYYQLALFWAVSLTLCMVAQLISSKHNYNYRQKGSRTFVQKLNEVDSKQTMDRLLKTEQQYLADRRTVAIEKQKRRESRLGRTSVSASVELKSRQGGKLKVPNQLALSKSSQRVSGYFGGDQFLMTEQEAGGSVQVQQDQPAQTQYLQLPQSDVNQQLAIEPNNQDAVVEEKPGSRRLQVTDQEVMAEFETFQEQIHKVTLKSRYFAWFSLMILLVIGLCLTYISSFAHLYVDESGGTSPFDSQEKQHLVFLFFWAGVYSDMDYEPYARSVYPFYVLMILLIFERLAQLWIETKFGCDQDLVLKFKQIESKDKYYRNLHKERKKEIDRLKNLSNRRTRRAKSQSGRMMSMISSATSEDDDGRSRSELSDSFCTDQDMKSKSLQSRSLLTIEEDKKELDESIRRSTVHQHSGSMPVEMPISSPDGISSHTSINASYREKPEILIVSDADRLISDEKKADSVLIESKEQKLTIIEEGKEVISDKTKLTQSYDQESMLDDYSKRDELKRSLIKELKPLMNVNSRLKLYKAMKQMIENFCILLVWFSCIYKQNVLSMILFFFLVIYTYYRSGNALLMVRTTVVILFVLQYWFEVFNLSSYNSPKTFPGHLIGQNFTTYPNPEIFYYNVPFILSYDQFRDPDGALNATANLNYTSYLAMDAEGRKLNGIWIDFTMTVAVAIYFSLCNFWMLFRPVKVTQSEDTIKMLKQYQKIIFKETGRMTKLKQLKRELKQQFGLSKLIKGWSEALYTTFPIILIAFTLAISIFNQSILSFGYIIFVMILVFDNIHFLKQQEGQERMHSILKYFMLPYLLFDILLQLIYQMPIQAFEDQSKWQMAIGFERVWRISPATLFLGDPTDVHYDITSSLTTMMLKGVTFFFITIQLQLISSFGYQKFMNERLEGQAEQIEKVGRGITYRFNNFKSKAVLKQAKETQQVDRMLWHVKRLIRKRELLYKNAHSKKEIQTPRSQSIMRGPIELGMGRIDESKEKQSSSESEETYDQKFQTRCKNEKSIIKRDYEERLDKLSCCNKLYLWIRRNWVVDILFQTSDQHLDDIVNQMRNGRTNIKTQVEIGSNILSKQERQHDVDRQLQELVEKEIADKMKVKNQIKSKKKADAQKQEKPEISDDVDAPDKEIEEESKEIDKGQESELTKMMQSDMVRDSAEFNNNLAAMLDNIDDPAKDQNKQEKKLLGDLLKSKIYRPSPHPWEQVDVSKFLTWQLVFKRYLVVTYKTLISYSELFCYFMMLLATFMKAGWLYMIYPIAIFGYCMLEEQRPGKVFWFFILFYTQSLLIITFIVQLQLWQEVLSDERLTGLNQFFDSNTLGIQRLDSDSFGSTFKFYFPEIFIMFTTLVHIQRENLSGVFNVPYERYETFEEGLLRYRLQVLCTTEAERKLVSSNFSHDEALTMRLDKETIAEYMAQDGSLSETDKFKQSERNGSPIRVEKRHKGQIIFLDKQEKADQLNERQNEILLSDENERESNPLQDLNVLVEHEEFEMITPEQDDSSSELSQVKSEDNIVYKNKGKEQSKFTLVQWAKWLIYDNPFMNRLFPEIKQQKPGKDLYVFVATIQIILVAYVFLFYSNMEGNKSDIATQFSSNQYSAKMVILLIVMIGIMVVDRVFYSTHALLSGSNFSQDETLRRASPLQRTETQLDQSMVGGLGNPLASSGENSDTSMLHRESGQPYGRRQQALYNMDSEKQEKKKQNNWIEEQLAISDDSSDAEDDLFSFNKNLMPQKQQKSYTRVVKFYWFWFVILSAHYFVFFGLPNTIEDCKNTFQLDSDTNSYIEYSDPRYKCNTFTNNAWIVIFYLLLSIYFFIQAYQMRIGLPEIRKGSFLMDSFNPVSGVIYRAYLGIPFIFELRTLTDWTFTTTSLDAFQWIKLAKIQADMYVAKCVNKDYMDRDLGARIKKWEKIVVGFGLMLFIILMIIGPIILFSSLNPIAQIDNPTGGLLKASLSFGDSSSSTNQTLPLFTTNQVTQIKGLTNEQYDTLNFNTHQETTANFEVNQTKVVQFSETSDIAWIISAPKKQAMFDYLTMLANGTLPSNIGIFYTLEYDFVRDDSQYGNTRGKIFEQITNKTQEQVDFALNLANQINCTESGISSTFPSNVTITQKTNQNPSLSAIVTGDPAMVTNYTLTFYCDPQDYDFTNNYWDLKQVFTKEPDSQTEVKELENNVFSGEGFGFILFQQKVMPSFFASYSTNLVVFYVGIVFVVATIFRSIFVPRTWEIFIIDAPFTEDILKICQSIHVYRVQRQLIKEEELYQILIDIMRSPEMIKALCGSSLKKKLQ